MPHRGTHYDENSCVDRLPGTEGVLALENRLTPGAPAPQTERLFSKQQVYDFCD